MPEGVLERGAAYLRKGYTPGRQPYPPLWISKVLYAPEQVIEGAILAALLAYENLSKKPLFKREQQIVATRDDLAFEPSFERSVEASG
jgi:hypothetical protein